MAKKVLGQSNPSATTVTTLYTVPASKEAVISSISVANLAAADATFDTVSYTHLTLPTKRIV